MKYTELFIRFTKEYNLYIPILKTYSLYNVVYDGFIEDKLFYNNRKIKYLFPMPIIGTTEKLGNNDNEIWISFLTKNNIDIDIIPNPSENWNDIPDKLFDEFYLMYKDEEEYKEIFTNFFIIKTKYKNLCDYLRTSKRIIDGLFDEVDYDVIITRKWIDFIASKDTQPTIY